MSAPTERGLDEWLCFASDAADCRHLYGWGAGSQSWGPCLTVHLRPWTRLQRPKYVLCSKTIAVSMEVEELSLSLHFFVRQFAHIRKTHLNSIPFTTCLALYTLSHSCTLWPSAATPTLAAAGDGRGSLSQLASQEQRDARQHWLQLVA